MLDREDARSRRPRLCDDAEMYNPSQFAEKRPEVLAETIAQHPLASLITVGRDGNIVASHIPLLLDPADGPLGTLRGHMARANSQWQETAPDSEALAIFRGPQHYISPNWYPTKSEHGKVVPTWNYVVVHARGRIRFPDDPTWLLRNVSALTDHQERGVETPWRVTDAPPDYTQGLLRAIVGVELEITHLEGKWKVSQNRGEADRQGVISGLRATSTDVGSAMATLVDRTLKRA